MYSQVGQKVVYSILKKLFTYPQVIKLLKYKKKNHLNLCQSQATNMTSLISNTQAPNNLR